jgi:hypothetical protein
VLDRLVKLQQRCRGNEIPYFDKLTLLEGSAIDDIVRVLPRQ